MCSVIKLFFQYLHVLYPLLNIQPTAVPAPPQELSVEFDESTNSLTITWQPPENLGDFDLDNYTVNITSNSGTDISVPVHASTTTLRVLFERTQRATFNVKVTATNMCGQTGGAALESEEYVPSKATSHPLC